MAQERFHCRWAFLGLSAIAEKFIRDLNLARDKPDPITHSLVAVSTTGTFERAGKWLVHQDVPQPGTVQIFTDYHEMLQVGNYDVVYISTPHSVHFKHARDSIVAGRNVLLEKPAVMNSRQWKRLASLSKEHGVVLMEAMWTRYFPLTQHLQDHILPRIGSVKRILADYSVPLFGDPTLHPSSRFLNKSTGSGSLLDLGVYPLTWVDIALDNQADAPSSTTRVKVVHAETIEHNTPSKPIDDITTVVLSRKQEPVTAIVTISSSLPGSAGLGLEDKLLRKKNAPAIRIQGVLGEVSIPFPPIRPESLTVQWYSPDKLDEGAFETEEIIKKPVHGWGLWYQADVLAKALGKRHSSTSVPGQGLVIGEGGSNRVMEWTDEARARAGIVYGPELEAVW